jgi:hypothetical protein
MRKNSAQNGQLPKQHLPAGNHRPVAAYQIAYSKLYDTLSGLLPRRG